MKFTATQLEVLGNTVALLSLQPGDMVEVTVTLGTVLREHNELFDEALWCQLCLEMVDTQVGTYCSGRGVHRHEGTSLSCPECGRYVMVNRYGRVPRHKRMRLPQMRAQRLLKAAK